MIKHKPTNYPPVVFVVGMTATGKTELGVQLARHFDGEIIAADSRTVYRHLDIGTAKPTQAERKEIRHYGIDVIEPNMRFTAFDFKELAVQAIGQITSKKKLPIVVGGTGLYIDALIYDYAFRPAPSSTRRDELRKLSIYELQRLIQEAGLQLPTNSLNPRHLIRLLESGESPKQHVRRPNSLILGLTLPRDVLKQRVSNRVDAMVSAGLVEEVRSLSAHFDTAGDAFQTPGYKAILAYVNGEISLGEAKRLFVQSDMRLSKRQLTWFRRNESIQWLPFDQKYQTAVSAIDSFLIPDDTD